MASNKDILEAQRFNRRRLVTAFTSGTPGGRELEPRSHVRPLLVGAVIALVLLGVAAVMGRFSPTLPKDWQNSTLVVVKGTGARYFTVDGVLRPVTNITSARLLSEPGSYRFSEVGAKAVAGIPRGTTIGVPDAPDNVPAPQDLDSDQWVACAPATGTRTWIGTTPSDLTPQDSAVVTDGEQTYVIADGRRHLVDPEARSGVLLALGLEATPAHRVGGEWLNLFQWGSDLVPLEIPDAGLPASGLPARLSTAVIGSVVEVEEGASQRRYVVTGNATMAPLSDVAHRLFQIGRSGTIAGNPLQATVAEVSGVTVDPAGPAPSDWPATLEAPVSQSGVPCATLVTGEGASSTALGSVPADPEGALASSTTVDEGDAASPGPGNAQSGGAAGAAGATVTVKGGSGALVRTTSGGTLGAIMLITDAGTSHGLGDEPSDSLARLGYTDADVTPLPAPWAALVPGGVTLSADAAWETVGSR